MQGGALRRIISPITTPHQHTPMSKPPFASPTVASIAPIAAFAALAFTGCATFPPQPGAQAKGYEGASLPQAQVATVFALDGRPNYESGYICQINGKPATPQGGCASVVYLKPGAHRLTVKYQSRLEVGEAELPIRVEAGKVYQLNATSFRTNNRGWLSIIPMPQGTKLTYRNIAPNLFDAAKVDEPIPYGEK